MADIQLITGCMFSGKSTELIRRVNIYKSVNKNIIVLNSSLDSRTCDAISTHDNKTIKAHKTDSLIGFYSNYSKLNEIDVFAIDEAQFFQDLFDFLIMIEKNKIIVIVAGLDGDYKRQKFGQILDCIPICSSVTKLTALCQHTTSDSCKCANKALFSKRIHNDVSQVCIGAGDKYIPVCREHYLN